ncbi:hypothetical protein CROQUDRAFT_719238 [Cronartium quercuum f. sp. fusiforme G11]|uniref:Uncharacterized protein n=1 Tax=Cronartium quercuum f. sp. fusiforme G11 TaxID=708437 RepID=A0A9P6NY13_9BASI|nr:hypothetical protein CROQUDRAFT_719238 [Cronartium quercuum f. sp. fusiforme G11]
MMKILTTENIFRWVINATLCLTVCARLGRILSLAHMARLNVPFRPYVTHDPSVAKTRVLKANGVLKGSRYEDPTYKLLFDHLHTSPKVTQLEFYKNRKVIETLKRDGGLDLAEEGIIQTMERSGMKIPANAFKLQLWGSYVKVNWEQLSKLELDRLIARIDQKIDTDTKGARIIADKYSRAISEGRYGVIMDNEADDLLYLLMNFEDNIIPRFIVCYGGFIELRYQSVLAFVEAACDHYEIPREKRPQVYRGFPHLYQNHGHRHPYDYEEGSGYIDVEKRAQYIKISQALEVALQNGANKTWKPDVWKHDTFVPGLNALRNMIDEEGYSAIAVLTCPAALTYLIKEDPTRTRRFGVTMASPYSYAMTQDGVLYTEAYNARRQISLMNELMRSGVDLIGVGGGTARTLGLRTLHDSKLGSNGAKLYPETGLEHLEEVITHESPFKIFRIIANAGHNVSVGKWRDWDERFTELWEFLEIEQPGRINLKEMREKPQFVIDLLEEEAEKAKKTKTEESKKKDEVPEAGKWELDRLMNTLRMWYLLGDQVRWQAPSADLHATITTQPYVKGILGAVRYASETRPVELDKEGQPIKKVKLDKLVNSDESNHYSISDMDFQLIKNRVQEILNKYYDKTKGLPSSTQKSILKSNL